MNDARTDPVVGAKRPAGGESESVFPTPQSVIRNLVCPKCRTAVPPAEVVADKHWAWCPRCQAAFALPLPPLDPAAGPPPVPAGVRVTDDGVTRKLAYRWFRPWTLLLVVGCVVWDVLLFQLGRDALARWQAVPWPVAVLLLTHTAAGAGMKYLTLCGLVNRTAVRVGDAVRVEHGPLPWPGAEVWATEVTAVACEPVLHVGKGKAARVTFTLRAATESGPTVTLLTGLDSLPRARFFEWQLEAWLDLHDRGRPATDGEPGVR